MTDRIDTELAAENLAELFGAENVVRLHSNLYRVRREIIEYANGGITTEDGQIRFGNPRWVKNSKGKLIARGLDKTKMDTLKSSIREQGMENPLRLRMVELETGLSLELINGERRMRSIDALIEEHSLCCDPATGSMMPAAELYEWVDCRINRMTDDEALELAMRPNETGESIGEVATIEVVRAHREIGSSDEKILRVTGMSTTWLRDTDRLLSLDPKTLSSLQTEQINRNLALKLADISNTNERLERLGRCNQSAIERIAAQEAALADSAAKDDEEAEIEAAAASLAEIVSNDPEIAKEHRTKSGQAKKRAKKKKEQKSQLEPVATSKDWDKTNKDGDPPKPVSHSKLSKHWMPELTKLVRQKGKDDEGNDLEIDLNDAHLAWTILEVILNGKRDSDGLPNIVQLLKQHAERKKDE